MVCFVLSGCGGKSGLSFPENFESNLPPKIKLDVRIVSQLDNYSCGTTSLAMAMSYHDKKMYYKQEVWDASGSSIAVARKIGFEIFGLKTAAKKYGFEKYVFTPGLNLDELKYLLTKDMPVVVFIRNFDKKSFHSVLVTGYDDSGVFVNDPVGRAYHVEYKKFLGHWYAPMDYLKGQMAYNSAFILFAKNKI